jgi:RNA polymerase sigma-54 factor
LHISAFYKKFLGENGTDNTTRQYIQKKIESAKWLIDAIEQRRSTLYKVSCKIVELQTNFLDAGVPGLRTLKMQDVADIVGVHVSTISRAIAHKYIQTPQGIFEMKFFFTGGFQNVDGSMESWEAIRQKLGDIVTKENKSNPLSDEEVAFEILNIYFEEVARRGLKRQLDFDSIINAYFYVLEKVKKKDTMLSSVKESVVKEETRLLTQTKEEVIPSIDALKEKIPQKN